jgi:hypothetical protein
MEITTVPSCRVGWQGQTLRYVVRAEGASEVLVPENEVNGVQVRVASTRQTGSGVEAQLEVKVLDSELL